jgi:hypothetical protein
LAGLTRFWIHSIILWYFPFHVMDLIPPNGDKRKVILCCSYYLDIRQICRIIIVSHLNMKKLVIILFLIAGLLGCQEKISPIVSGTVFDGGVFFGRYVIAPGQKPKTRVLNQKQLAQLSLWLQEQKSGFRTIVESPPPPSFSIVLKHANGSHTQIDLFLTTLGWQDSVVIWNTDPSKKGIRNISAQELHALIQLVKEKPNG